MLNKLLHTTLNYLFFFIKTKNIKAMLLGCTVVFLSLGQLDAQTVTNGNFSNGGSDWGCNPEIHRETVYGGSNAANKVAEIDASAGLCQTISGFTIGEVYRLFFVCSRRTTCGPIEQTMDVSIDGGALAPTRVSRTGAFNFTPEFFNFTATATSHTIEFNGTSAGTCGLIVDNIAVILVSLLPIELVDFSAKADKHTVALSWSTASEVNNHYFTIERSKDGRNWKEVTNINGAGNSTQFVQYSAIDDKPFQGVSYYRIKQTDFDGAFSYSSINTVHIDRPARSAVLVYPNPAKDYITIEANKSELKFLQLFNVSGQDISSQVQIFKISDTKYTVNISGLHPGLYYSRTETSANRIVKQ